MGRIQADLKDLEQLAEKTKLAKAKCEAVPAQLSWSLSGVLLELSGVWTPELEGLQQKLEKSMRDYAEKLGEAHQLVVNTKNELKAADEALLRELGLDGEIAPQKTSKGKAEGASKKKKEKEEGNAFTQSLKGIGDGAGDALSETWDGIVSFAKHPVDSTVNTAKGVYEAGKHPIRTYNTVKDGVVTAVDEKLIHGDAYSRSHFFSYAGTEIGLAALGDKGAGLAVKGAGTVSKTAKGMKDVHKVTVNQRMPALQPAFAGGKPPVNALDTGYLGRYLQNAKDMYWNFAKGKGGWRNGELPSFGPKSVPGPPYRQVYDGYPAKVKHGAQEKHLMEAPNYKEADKQAQLKGKRRKSVMYGQNNAEMQKLLDQYAGTGESVPRSPNKERVHFNQYIGEYYDEESKTYIPTTNAIIHYSKDGAHIVPARPDSE
ncbi:polymorphic toxin type 50 domain-containing protein [Priestia endophytica]|uniref:polymorphic toxin type 50 domain-containing protein n=1 Tax=Priestia endophytica TaxID=135735 RepID=UPI00227E3AB9|nr:polymorphic toxin type 50 domain-containing protein [Priestia endophytica]MCY8232890.1 polymorphic toxin type 50 domain-containing protein [Priestia endophytica]